MASLSLKNINKVYPNGFHAVKDFNLEIEDKEFIIFVGPSGCGKSTTLRMIAGLEEISSGELWIGDKLVNDVEPKDRDIAMVFQNYALYPHMSVYDNMAFGLKLRKVAKDQIDRLVHEAAKILERGGVKDIYAVASHGLFAGGAGEVLNASPIKEILVTDSVATKEKVPTNVKYISASELIANATTRIFERQPLSPLFAYTAHED